MSFHHPPFVIHDYTGDLLAQLHQASIDTLPPGQASEEASRKLITMIWKADLEFQARVANYNMYVPVISVILAPRRSQTPDLPENLRVELTPGEEAKCSVLKEQFKITQANQPVNEAFSEKAKTLEWNLAEIVASRIEAYYEIIKNVLEDELDMIPKSLAINFVSTLFDIAKMSLEAYHIEDPLPKALVSCPAFLLTASTFELSAPLGIGAIALISMAENYRDCLQNIGHLVNKIDDKLSEESKLKQLTKTVNRNKSGDYYERSDGRIEVFTNGELTNTITYSSPSSDKETGQYTEGDMNFEASHYTQTGSNGATEYCVSYHEWSDSGDYDRSGVECKSEVNSGDGKETIDTDHSID